LSSKTVQRVWPLATILGSNVALRSRGVSNSSSPKSPFEVLGLFQFRVYPGGDPPGRASHSPDDRSSRPRALAPEWLCSSL
jgi:hypothetical protein